MTTFAYLGNTPYRLITSNILYRSLPLYLIERNAYIGRYGRLVDP